jgi:hypothetical protein
VGWAPPQPPGGGNRKTLIAIIAGTVAAAALVVGAVVFINKDDGGKDDAADKSPSPSVSHSPTPEDSASFDDEASDPPTDDTLPSDDLPSGDASSPNIETMMPTPTSGPIPSYMLKVGQCFNVPAGKGGQGERISCSKAHDAEVVYKEKLTGTYDTDTAVKTKADSICKSRLDSKARRQPSGTVRGTLVQYPQTSGLRMGLKTVTCSLTAGQGRKLYKPLV